MNWIDIVAVFLCSVVMDVLMKKGLRAFKDETEKDEIEEKFAAQF
jgi:hypothetical protein